MIAFLSNQFNNCVLLNVQIFKSFFLHVFLIEIVNKHNGNIIATNGNNCFLTSCVTNLIRDKQLLTSHDKKFYALSSCRVNYITNGNKPFHGERKQKNT
jgi:hypothetical protein